MKLDDFEARAVAFDTETALIIPGNVAPPLVCGSMASALHPDGVLLDYVDAVERFDELLRSDRIIVGANIAYDMVVMANDAYSIDAGDDAITYGDAVLELIFAKYARGEVYDVQIAEALNAIAGGHLFKDPLTGKDLSDPTTKRRGRYSLSICVHQVLGRSDAKVNDFWRLRYAMLADLPLSEWPAEAAQYPKDDARNTLEVVLAQVKTHKNLQCMAAQAETAFAGALAGAQGLRTDPARVAALEERVTADRAAGAAQWLEAGFLIRPPCAACGHECAEHYQFEDRVTGCNHLVGRGKARGPCGCAGYAEPAEEDGKNKKAGKVVKAALARAYGATEPCPSCAGTGKVRNAKGNSDVICTDKNLASRGLLGCDGTGLDISKAPMLARTPTDGIQAGRDNLLESGDEQLINYAEYQEDDKLVNVYLPFLKKGVDKPITLRFNVLLASARASYDDVVQLLPRDGGIRECIIPPPGMVFCSTDYASGELVTFAQEQIWILGRSKMAEVINETKDPGSLHVLFAGDMMGISFEEAMRRYKAGDKQIKDYRQAAKAGNYGFGGGMGAPKFVQSKRKKAEGWTAAAGGPSVNEKGERGYWGIRFCILLAGKQRCGEEMITSWRDRDTAPVCRHCVESVDALKQQWLTTWDIRGYFAWVSNQVDNGGRMKTCPCGMVRGGLGFCDGANHNFQHLLACGAKLAFRLITREMYNVKSSPLYGHRANVFQHDDVLTSLWEDGASPAGKRQSTLMVQGLKEFCPDVHVDAQPALMRMLSKSAEPKWGPDGELLVWEPKEKKAA